MEKRIALVIGNSNYQSEKVDNLPNPINDANDIEIVLAKRNFQVIKLIDATLVDIHQAIANFLSELDDYEVGLLFYSGHGMEINGKNYIVPVDYVLQGKNKAINSCYCVNEYLEKAKIYEDKVKICIFDACRTNPFLPIRGASSGFTPFSDTPKGTIISFSTSVDCGAYDGIHSNGLYTQVLKEALEIPNLKIEDMFKSVRIQVAEKSKDEYGEEQITWEHSSLVGEFIFFPMAQSNESDEFDQEIYDFVVTQNEFYKQRTDDIFDIECMPLVDAQQKYHIPMVKIVRAYARIENSKHGIHHSNATIDQLNYRFLTSWGFKQKIGRWYYKNHYIEMGDFLPIPDEMKSQEPIEGKALEIDASIKAELKNGKLRIIISSNIPYSTPLIIALEGKGYLAQCKTVVSETETVSEWFSKPSDPIADGFYMIKVNCPINRLLPPVVQELFGERSRNICGRYVQFDPIWGNTIYFSYGVVIKGDKIILIDMQKTLSEIGI